MKEFVEKLIGKLEEYQENNTLNKSDDDYELGEFNACEYAIKIVNQLAEEYKTTYMEELIKAKRLCAYECGPECPFRLGDGECFLEELQTKLENNGWIPFTQRELTTEEKEEFDCDFDYMLTCKLPEDDTEILVCYKKWTCWNRYIF